MLNTKQPVLRRFWYATDADRESLKDGPQPFTLLGEPIVLFLDAKGRARGAGRSLLPPYREALEGLVPQRQYRVRLPRLGVRP